MYIKLLVDGAILAGTPCPFQGVCPLKNPRCPTDGDLKEYNYSCACARSYDFPKKSAK